MKMMKLTKQMREGFVARVMSDVPRIDYAERWRKRALEVAVDALPGALQPIYSLYPEYIRTGYVGSGAGHSGYLPVGDGHHDRVRTLIQNDSVAVGAIAACEAQNDTFAALKAKLEGVAAACTTCEQLLAALPELEKYVPVSPEPTRNLPALANLVADLVHAGWPKETISAP
jgi:Nucleotide modification associated domain 5